MENQKKENTKQQKKKKRDQEKKKEEKKINKKKIEATKMDKKIEHFFLSSSNKIRKEENKKEKKGEDEDDLDIDFDKIINQNSDSNLPSSSSKPKSSPAPKKPKNTMTFNLSTSNNFKKLIQENSLFEKEKMKYDILPSSINQEEKSQQSIDENQDQPMIDEKEEKEENLSINKSFDQESLQERQIEKLGIDENQEDWFKLANEIGNPGEITMNTSGMTSFDHSCLYEEDKSINFYFLDAFDNSQNLYLIGKVKRDNEYISCCVTLTNLTHKLFFVLKEGSQEKQVYGDLLKLMNKHGIKDWQYRSIEKEYAFDNPLIRQGKQEVYEVCYSTRYMKLADTKFSSEHIVCVVGSQVSLLENFLLEKKIMGPSWLNISTSSEVSQKQKVSWCSFELTVDEIENINLDNGKKETPKLTVLSLNVKTQFLESQQINEIVSISGIVSKDVNVETVEPLNKVRNNFRSFSVIRKLPHTGFPDQMKKMATQKSKKIEFVEDEKALLNYILSKIHSIDPDVIVGHNILGFDLDVLLHRMQKLRVSNWSKIGRLIRTEFPRLQKGAGGTGNSYHEEKSVLAGRLPCDTYINSRELVRLKNYTLGHLSETQLSIKRYELDDEDVSIFYNSAEKLLKFIEHAENDCYISLCLLYKLEMLPLTKQLTSLAGNLWSSTLQGGRAQRIEFLLLHEFYNREFLLPDKKENVKKKEEKKKNKPAYKGGLVLDPQVGFYDKIVLLLDFNSLYPSIIQEYNICFTTVTRNQDNEGKWIPSSVPDPNLSRGILPQVIKTLVDRRRQVKTELSKTKDPEKIQQLDIKQKAFKLTANSLYGCLGYKFSRFYAMPLAELVTRCGRETLQKTVNLANNSLNLRVIYGKPIF